MNTFTKLGVINLAGLALVWQTANEGALALVVQVDDFHICKILAVIFAFGLAWAMRQAWWLDRRSYTQPRTAGYWLEADYRLSPIQYTAVTLTALGLIGTMVGTTIALMAIDGTSGANAGAMLATVMHGVGMSFVKSIIGGVGCLWLMTNYRILSREAEYRAG